MRIQEAKIDPVIGSGSEDLTTSSSGEATLSIRLKLSYLVENCNLSPAGAMVGRNPTPQGLRRGQVQWCCLNSEVGRVVREGGTSVEGRICAPELMEPLRCFFGYLLFVLCYRLRRRQLYPESASRANF